ncbi:MAG: CoA-binding protein [Epsilonproteobacteria bacterium]|nr:CoA-binding protein [Campylobacterota bacterium]
MKEAQIYSLLQKYGIKTPEYKVISLNEEPDFEIFPCVLKIHSSKVIHKSDVGGVIVDIKDSNELKKAKEKILSNIQKAGIKLGSEDGFIIEEKLSGIEMFIGGVFDNIFEEVLLFGEGGVLIEIEKDITYIDALSPTQEIKKAINKTKISKIFPSFRGKNYDINEVIQTIQKFQKLFLNEDIKEFDINPLLYTSKGLVAVDARIKSGKPPKKTYTPKKHPLFENQKVAIIGVSENPQKVGYALAKNSLNSQADIYFVNPKLQSLFDKKVYKLEDLPQVDTAVIAIPPKFVPETIEYLAQKGTKNFIIISAGFKESGNTRAERELKDIAAKYDLNIIGPNCLGIYNAKSNLNLTFAKSPINKGDTALISQSGAVLTALLDKAVDIGFSHIISMGNMADFNFANAIEEINRHAEAKSISIYAEGLQEGKAFLNAIRNSKKPIFLYKAGKSEAAKKAAFSHTGNIAGNYEMILTLTQSAGAVIKDSIESLIFAPKYKDIKEVTILTNAGGPGTILTDLVTKHKKLMPLSDELIEKLNKVLPPTWSKNNPIDIIGDATSSRYKAALDILEKESELIFVIVTPQFMTDEQNIAKILKKYKNTVPIFLGEYSFKNIDFGFNSLEEAAKIL